MDNRRSSSPWHPVSAHDRHHPSGSAKAAPRKDLEARIQAILESKNTNLSRVSRISRGMQHVWPSCFVPHNLYHLLRLGNYRPSLPQLFALSRATGYRLYDWLTLFDLDPGVIAPLQARLPRKRTILLDTCPDYRDGWRAVSTEDSDAYSGRGLVPLSRRIRFLPSRPDRASARAKLGRFLYAKLGLEDAFAFPDLMPGSVVRVKAHTDERDASPESNDRSGRIFLVQYPQGLICSRLDFESGNRIILRSAVDFDADIILSTPREARILGVVDTEYRDLRAPAPDRVSLPPQPETLTDRRDEKVTMSEVSVCGSMNFSFGASIQSVRNRSGMSLREVSALSRVIVAELDDPHYFVAEASLSDYEAGECPRSVEKLVTLCAAYGLDFGSMVFSLGGRPSDFGAEEMPRALLGVSIANSADIPMSAGEIAGNGSLDRLDELPLFQAGYERRYLRLRRTHLSNWFWAGSESFASDRLLRGVQAVSLDTGKTAASLDTPTPWHRLLYVVLTRDGLHRFARPRPGSETFDISFGGKGMPDNPFFVVRSEVDVLGQVRLVVRSVE